MSGFTPGPWSLGVPTEFGVRNPDGIYFNEHERVAQVYGLPQHCFLQEIDAGKYAEAISNARLIAAAPELLEVLQRLWMEADLTDVEQALVKNVIRKATGAAE